MLGSVPSSTSLSYVVVLLIASGFLCIPLLLCNSVILIFPSFKRLWTPRDICCHCFSKEIPQSNSEPPLVSVPKSSMRPCAEQCSHRSSLCPSLTFAALVTVAFVTFSYIVFGTKRCWDMREIKTCFYAQSSLPLLEFSISLGDKNDIIPD